MRNLLIGIDSGTQSTKVLVVDARNGKVLGSASRPCALIPGLPPGAKEQHPRAWRQAAAQSIKAALKNAGASAGEIAAIGVSGQQHGFVPLDKEGEVIRPAKLWCDTSTAAECEEITEKLGGLKQTIRALGNAVLPGFTASKILWLKNHEPKNYQRLATVLLPHDYLNFWLTGEKTMEYGDASGTALLDVRKRKWSEAALKAIDPELAGKLPPLMRSDRPAGRLQASTAKLLDLNPGVLVSAGGGDNMMGAIGTGNTRAGVITASFGTSGTIYACAEKPVVDPQGEIAAFCDSTNRWLPLLCTMNVTVATEMVREDFGWSHEKFAAEAARVPAGSRGLLLLPYFEGERTPNVPDGTGVWFGVNQKTFEAGHFARAAMEGVTLGMNYGLRRLAELGVKPTQIRATGGGAKSKVWRQIMADVFNAEVVTLKVSEGAAYGAALQALWCWRLQQHDRHFRLVPKPLQGPVRRGSLHGGALDHLLNGLWRAGQLAAQERLHHDDGQTLGGGKLQSLRAGLILCVHVVVLNLAEGPAVEAIDDFWKAVVTVVEGETKMADAPVGHRRPGLFQELEFQNDFVPSLFAQGVEQIEINVVGLEPGKLLVQEAVEIGFLFYHPNRAFGGYFHAVAPAAQGLAEHRFAAAFVIDVSGVEIVDTSFHGAVHHADGLRFLDVRANGISVGGGKTHAAEAEHGGLPVQFAEFAILHGRAGMQGADLSGGGAGRAAPGAVDGLAQPGDGLPQILHVAPPHRPC
jgi:xylulokinase